MALQNNPNDLINRNFINIPIPGLGDCFYETLRLYGKLYNIPQLNRSVKTLREYAFSEIMRQRDLNEEFQVVLTNIESTNLDKIKQKQKYLNNGNIAAVQLAYRIFNINIVFYNLDANGLRIDRYPDNNNPYYDTIHIIRKDDIHFELLIPIGDPIQIYGLANIIRDTRLLVNDLEMERDTIIAYILDGKVKKNVESVNNEFDKKIRAVLSEQQEIVQQASELMVDPKNKQEAREASMRVLHIFHRGHISNPLIQQFREESLQEPGAAVKLSKKNLLQEPGAAPVKRKGPKIAPSPAKLAQEKSNALLAAKLLQDESNARNATIAQRIAQEKSNALFAATLLKKRGGKTKKAMRVKKQKTKKLKKRSV